LHQKWSGANLKDREVELASNKMSSSLSNQKGGGSTEDQFYKHRQAHTEHEKHWRTMLDGRYISWE
jgi:hypothetical protein